MMRRRKLRNLDAGMGLAMAWGRSEFAPVHGQASVAVEVCAIFASALACPPLTLGDRKRDEDSAKHYAAGWRETRFLREALSVGGTEYTHIFH